MNEYGFLGYVSFVSNVERAVVNKRKWKAEKDESFTNGQLHFWFSNRMLESYMDVR